MGGHDDPRPGVGEGLDSRDGSADAAVIGNDPALLTVGHRDVQVGAQQHAPTRNVKIGQFEDRHRRRPHTW